MIKNKSVNKVLYQVKIHHDVYKIHPSSHYVLLFVLCEKLSNSGFDDWIILDVNEYHISQSKLSLIIGYETKIKFCTVTYDPDWLESKIHNFEIEDY